ncbi:type I restriction enzyme HsdR N-terminal domain-containing protein [Sneathiella chinensis]|uniref:Type I restriction enzyme R protein N-terminal domain-containing protein n=1 Tax=Sneathiella chinensis TaxID=349750 RepID=A0ABQ5U7N1_9PROT|nr:type I restriction enzyme HsdR N-terminal domain-containing protein [Sneathiella chinensis]GLQ07317.1 hypothetical protein GCM10007924_25380 [Sneathiella chinensis]
MDLIDRLQELSARIKRQKDHVLTEEAAKTAFVLPFVQALGYDVFNPSEVVPELTADHGMKKGEKVDYGIKQDDGIVMLIECKPVGSQLAASHAGQLFRYFSVTEARFGVLTDGVRYLFYTDLDRPNQMDERPFFEFDILNFGGQEIEELKKFTKTSFDIETIVSTASNLKYHRALMVEIGLEYNNPTEEFVKIFTNRVYLGRFTQQVREQFTELVQRAFEDFVREKVNARLKSALETGGATKSETSDVKKPTAALEAVVQEGDDGIVTTEEEIMAFRIVQAIGAEVVDVDRIYMRDAKSYCAILLDDNNRKSICRLIFLKTKMSVLVFTPGGETRQDIGKVEDIFALREQIQAAIRQFDEVAQPA